MTETYDFLVIGGGLVGTAIAWGLAGDGQRVALLDEGDVAYRAARGNFALVWVQGKGLGMPQYASWTRRSADGWQAFAATLRQETGIDVAFRRPGGFQLCLSEAELAARVEGLRQLQRQPGMQPYDYDVLDRRGLAAVLPDIGPDVLGATYSRLDGHCNALKLLRALHLGLQSRGGSYLPEQPVRQIEFRAGSFLVRTADRDFSAGRIALAAGLGNARLGSMVGLDARVRPQRGQIIVTERARPFLAHPMSTLRQTDEGSVLIGDSLEEAGFDDQVGLGVLATMADRAVRMFPLLGGLNVVRSWGALRVMTPDGFPIYEQSADCPGAFLATCHSGVTLAANHALALPAMMTAGRLGPELDVFSARRFDVPSAG
jgi:hydrogen cyanide synthase HcnC